ncbi:hypothetical protein MVEN_01792800 [Mycena venus]|uniref:F-box domain-containing protein n=1 Tax=Mycena venus TaxID=2733690 RepID=A0A8H7CLH3_9AGAR|nr:hypothetical protein MVEN_01792800 [Mycena venus]
MPTLQDLSNEVLLQILPHCPLKSLISARGVCALWRHLVPLAASPARRGLLDLYLRIIESPVFHITRSWLLERLHPFDREGYVNALLEQHKYLPEDFRIWILEWPAKAMSPTTNPTAPDFCSKAAIGLGAVPRVVHTVLFTRRGRSAKRDLQDVPALLVREQEWGEMIWLILCGKPTCSHAVYRLVDAQYDGDEEIPRVGSDDPDDPDLELSDDISEAATGDQDVDPDFELFGNIVDEGSIGDEEFGEEDMSNGEKLIDDEEIAEDVNDIDLQADYELGHEREVGVYSSWTYWLAVAFEETEAMARFLENNPHPPMGLFQNERHTAGEPMSHDEAFHSNQRMDRVWTERQYI